MSEFINQTMNKELVVKLVEDTLDAKIPYFMTLSGAHVYGFPSVDSDIDIRGAYLYNKETLMGFWDYNSIVTEARNLVVDGISHDIKLFELNRYIKNIIKGDDGHFIEQVLSGNIIYNAADFDEFLSIVRRYYLSKRLYNYYNDFTTKKIEELSNQDEKKVRTLLYAFRSLFTGITLFKTSEINVNIKTLNDEHFKISYIDDLIYQKTSEESPLQDISSDIYLNDLDNLRLEFEKAYQQTSLPACVRNKHKLTAFVAEAYSKHLLKKGITIPVMRHSEDTAYKNKAREKLLLSSSPFFSIEKELNLKLSPQKIVFIPDLDRYFLIKREKPRGKHFEFIDIELFFVQLLTGNPFCLLAAFNPDKDHEHSRMTQLDSLKHQLITKNIYTSFKSVAITILDKFKASKEPEYDPKQAIVTFAILYQGTIALQTGMFNYDFSPYIKLFESIKNCELTKTQIINTYEDMINQIDKAYTESTLPDTKPDKSLLLPLLTKIKKSQWLS